MNQTKKKNPLKRLLSMRGMGQVVTVTIGLIVLLVAFALINPNFWSPTNRTNLLRQIAPILIIGIAQSYVLITGNIDLSIGSVVGMSTMVAATLMSKGIMSPIPALLVTPALLSADRRAQWFACRKIQAPAVYRDSWHNDRCARHCPARKRQLQHRFYHEVLSRGGPDVQKRVLLWQNSWTV